MFGNRTHKDAEIEHRLTVIESLLKTLLALLSFVSLSLLWVVGNVQANSEWRRSHEAFLRQEDPYKRLDKVEADVSNIRGVLRIVGAAVLIIATPVVGLLFEAVRKAI